MSSLTAVADHIYHKEGMMRRRAPKRSRAYTYEEYIRTFAPNKSKKRATEQKEAKNRDAFLELVRNSSDPQPQSKS